MKYREKKQLNITFRKNLMYTYVFLECNFFVCEKKNLEKIYWLSKAGKLVDLRANGNRGLRGTAVVVVVAVVGEKEEEAVVEVAEAYSGFSIPSGILAVRQLP